MTRSKSHSWARTGVQNFEIGQFKLVEFLEEVSVYNTPLCSFPFRAHTKMASIVIGVDIVRHLPARPEWPGAKLMAIKRCWFTGGLQAEAITRVLSPPAPMTLLSIATRRRSNIRNETSALELHIKSSDITTKWVSSSSHYC